MIETTLMTFLLQAPPSVIAVELVGSWDNFTKAYSLKKDKRTGHDNWRGCHTFTNITCDGEGFVSSGRNGGLKMGGKYWYFYRLDGDIEYHNPVEPSTTSCPFLPGQPVNILEVPMQIDPLGTLDQQSSSGSIEPAVFTLDPSTKYCKPKPFAHKVEPACGRVYDRFFESATSRGAPKFITQASDLQSDDLDRKSEVSTIPCSELNERPKSFQSSVKRSILLTIDKMRGSRSAGSNAWQELKSGLRQPSLKNITVPSRSPGDPGKSSSTGHVNDNIKYMISDFSKIRDNTTWNVSKDNFSHNAVHSCLETSEPTDNEISTSSNGLRNTPLDRLPSPYLYSDKCFTEQQSTMFNATDQLMGLDVLHPNMSADFQSSVDNVDDVDISISRETNEDLRPYRNEFRYHARRQNNSISSSYHTTENFSPGLASSVINTDGMSPYHLPQPETPSISEFGDDNFVSEYKLQDPVPNIEPDKLSLDRLHLGSSASVHDAAYPGFQGYSLPKTEYESALTLRKLPSNPLTADCESPFKNQGNKDLIHSWNDDGHHRISQLNELVDDLGYLGELII